MKKYFCDVCGAELAAGGKTLTASPDSVVTLCNLEDLCPRCEGLAREPDASALVLKELRRMAERNEELPAPPPPLTGRNAREKRAVLAAVEAYRREHGPGSIPKLARLAKVAESELRNMISCAPVPIATWRKVGRALGVAGTRKPEEGTA